MKLNIPVPYDSAIPTLRIYPKEIKTSCSHKDLYKNIKKKEYL